MVRGTGLTFMLIYGSLGFSGGSDGKESACNVRESESVSHSVMYDSLQSRGVYSPPGSSVPGILQARILEWVAMRSTRGSSWSRDWTCISCIARKFFTLWAPREQCRRPGFSPWIGTIPWRREWLHTPVFLHGEFPWTEGLGRLRVHGLQRVRHDWVNVTFFLA